MKFRCGKTQFAEAVVFASNIVNSKHPVMILHNLKIEVRFPCREDSEGTVNIYASDGQVSTVVPLECPVREEGDVLVPADLLRTMVNSIVSDEIIVSSDDHRLEIISMGKSKKIPLFANDEGRHVPGEYLDLPVLEVTERVELPSGVVKKLTNQTTFATSDEINRCALSGIHVLMKDDVISFASTDRKRVSYSRAHVTLPADFTGLIPYKAMSNILKLLPHNENVYMGIGESHVCIKTDYAPIYARLLDGKFPPYEAFLEKPWRYELTLDKKELLDSVKEAACFNSKECSTLRFRFQPGELIITGRVDNKISEVRFAIPSYDGEEMSIGINYQHVSEAVKATQGGSVVFKFDAPDKPVMFVEDNDYKHIIMVTLLEEEG